MNAIKSLALVLLLTTATLTGCLEETGPDDGSTPSFSATIAGRTWTAESPSATRVVPPNALTIIGSSSASGDYISINLRASKTGSYSLDGTTHMAVYKKDGVEYTTQNGSGTLNISKYDEEKKLVSGTFSFVAKSSSGSSITVSNGTFANIKWSEQ